MSAKDEPLDLVFKALDTENKGYITVDQFISTFREFYDTSTTCKDRRISVLSKDIMKVVQVLDPMNGGVIHYGDFKRAFEGNINLDEVANANGNKVLSNENGSDKLVRSSYVSDGLENKTDDSGVHMQDSTVYDVDNDSTFSMDGSQSVQLSRGEIRGSWPKHRANPFSQNQSSLSPASTSQSDIMMSGMDMNYEALYDQMRQMQEKMENLQMSRDVSSESRVDRLREENARLSAQLTLMEERVREADARTTRAVESERQHTQSMMTRSSREHQQEVDNLRSRINQLETDCSELRVNTNNLKAENQKYVFDLRRANDTLAESQDQLQNLQQEMNALNEKHTRELEVLRQDRDHAVRVLEELNSSIGERRRSRFNSGSISGAFAAATSSEVMARYQEVQEIVRRLTAENKTLRRQLEDAQEELLTHSLEIGKSLIKSSEKSWAAEIDNCTKEEVVELLTKEKYANEQLRKYIDNLITRIIERHPSLLEIASGPT